MSSVIARRILATPIRTSSEAWEVIRQLLAPDKNSPAHAILERASGVACSSIASEVPKSDEFALRGSGPRVRIYCLYDDDAIAGEDANEAKLPDVPTENDWRLSIPVLEEDYEWSTRAIKSCAPHVSVRKAGEELSDDDETSKASNTLHIKLDRFLKQ